MDAIMIYLEPLWLGWQRIISMISVLLWVTVVSLVLLVLVALVTPLFREELLFDPQPEGRRWYQFLTKVLPGRVKYKMRGEGRFVGLIRAIAPPFTWSNPLWSLYEWYMWKFGLRIIGPPYFQALQTYELRRFKTRDIVVEGRQVQEFYPVIDTSDHVRILPTTFPLMVSGAEVQTIPFTVKGAIQYRIKPGGVNALDETASEWKALFNSDNWAVLLDFALKKIVRDVVAELKVDDLIGKVQRDIWAPDEVKEGHYVAISKEILERLRSHKLEIDGKEQSLEDVASIQILSVDINEFLPELDEEELKQLRAAIFGRQAGRARALEGQGEAELQDSILKSAATHGEHGKVSILAEAIVRATKHGTLDALLAAFLRNVVTKGN